MIRINIEKISHSQTKRVVVNADIDGVLTTIDGEYIVEDSKIYLTITCWADSGFLPYINDDTIPVYEELSVKDVENAILDYIITPKGSDFLKKMRKNVKNENSE